MPGPGPVVGPPVLNHNDLGGVHFTGSTYVFSTIWLAIGSDIRKYQSYPRIVGETGGKDFIFDAPWLTFIPGFAILIVVLSFNLFGEGLRDVLNPKLYKG